MSIKGFGAVVIAALAIGAVSASSASATLATTAAEWYTGTTQTGVTTLITDRSVTAAIAEHSPIGKKFELTGVIGGTAITLTATGIECAGCEITNMEVTGHAGNVAIGKGKLVLTGVTEDVPTPCAVAGGKITTQPLTFHADWMHEGKWFLHFFPTTGSTFANFEITGASPPCPDGSFKLTGSVYGEGRSGTNSFRTTQEVTFSPAIQTTVGGTLALGTQVANLTGTAGFQAGGQFFGVK